MRHVFIASLSLGIFASVTATSAQPQNGSSAETGSDLGNNPICSVVSGDDIVSKALTAFSDEVQTYNSAKLTQVDYIHKKSPGQYASCNMGMFLAKEAEAVDVDHRRDQAVSDTNFVNASLVTWRGIMSRCNQKGSGANITNECNNALNDLSMAAQVLYSSSRDAQGNIGLLSNQALAAIRQPPWQDTWTPHCDHQAGENMVAYTNNVNRFNVLFNQIDGEFGDVVQKARRLSADISTIARTCNVN
jgi:hypothetical protein